MESILEIFGKLFMTALVILLGYIADKVGLSDALFIIVSCRICMIPILFLAHRLQEPQNEVVN